MGQPQGLSPREITRDMVKIATPQIVLASASWRVPGLLHRRAAKMFFQNFPRDGKQLHDNGTANGVTTATEPNGVSLSKRHLSEIISNVHGKETTLKATHNDTTTNNKNTTFLYGSTTRHF